MNEKRNKKILLIYLGRKGGGAVYSYEMAKALAKTDNNVTAVVSEYLDNLEFWEKIPDIKLIKLKTYRSKISYLVRSVFFNAVYAKIKNELDKEYDLVYIPMTAYWDDKILKKINYKKLFTTVHDPKPHSGETQYNKRIPESVRKADLLIVLSEVFVQYMREKYQKPVIHIPHGRFNYYRDNFSSSSNNSNKKERTFLFFGRIEEYKGIGILLEALNILQSRQENVKLVIAGAGDISKYKKQLDDLKNVEVINKWLTDKETAGLFEKDNYILIVPYIDATQSGVIPIAMEYKIPVIASRTGGLSEQIRDGETGLLCRVNDAEDLAEKMRMLYNDESMCLLLSQNACAELKKYDWNVLVGQLLEN